MPLKVIAVGKKHESWVQEGIARYQMRLRAPFVLEWVLLPHSHLEGLSARQEESGRILSRLSPTDIVILLDERGKALDSPVLSRLLGDHLNASQTVVMVIGGAYGVDDTVHSRAHVTWSLSPLVFPHQLVRLIVAEQVYRAQEIARGGSYHHE